MTQLFQDFISGKNSDWTKLRGIELYGFMDYLVKSDNFIWVNKLRESIAKRLEGEGLVYFRGLGWVYPDEIENSGLNKFIPNQIDDMQKFKAYCNYKKDQEAIKFAEDKTKEFKQKLAQEEEAYLQNLVEGGINDLF